MKTLFLRPQRYGFFIALLSAGGFCVAIGGEKFNWLLLKLWGMDGIQKTI